LCTDLDGGTVGEGIGVRHAELDDVGSRLVEDADRLLGGVDATVARADERDEGALPALLEVLEGLGDGQRLRGHGAARVGATLAPAKAEAWSACAIFFRKSQLCD
jgi:hypothetical protein